ncbi:MAG TPA: HU family DNA-binding protein [Victivallales bacterium]|nr:HU family DNA-binding protein [Victivallales bacterium]|tara:strand:- start:512 stop:832 length:321 start_codon:yes stop_codon:yes gene_type:complete
MTKRDLILKIANGQDNLSSDKKLTQNQIAEIVQKTIDCISDELATGNNIEFRNFGTFQVIERKQKKGRNPNKPKNEVIIPAHSVVRFKPGVKLKKRVGMLDVSTLS